MSRYFGIGVGVVALSLALLGCGSDGVSHSTHASLQEELAETQEALETTETELETTQQELHTTEDELETTAEDLEETQGQLEASQQQTEQAQRQRDAAREQIDEAEETAAQAQQSAREAEERAAEVERTREASQRAQYLQAEMLSLAVPVPLGTDVTMNVPSRGNLQLRRPGTSWRQATLGGSGLRSTTMPLTSSANTGKTVVYSDRELSRPLLEHFGHLRDPSNRNQLEFTGAELTFAAVDEDGESTDGVVDTSVGGTTAWQLTLPRSTDLSIGMPKLVPGVPDTSQDPVTYTEPAGLEDARTANSYPLSLFGMSGQLVCSGCQVTLTPAYADTADDNGRYELDKRCGRQQHRYPNRSALRSQRLAKRAFLRRQRFSWRLRIHGFRVLARRPQEPGVSV